MNTFRGFLILLGLYLFIKNYDVNWQVGWHQDKTIAVSNRIHVNGWKNWTKKGGLHHVQPSLNVLSKMVSLRVFIDDANKKMDV